ncbi:MAG: hypothetical protein N2B03_00565, partial [Boseongicola sp.]
MRRLQPRHRRGDQALSTGLLRHVKTPIVRCLGNLAMKGEKANLVQADAHRSSKRTEIGKFGKAL